MLKNKIKIHLLVVIINILCHVCHVNVTSWRITYVYVLREVCTRDSDNIHAHVKYFHYSSL